MDKAAEKNFAMDVSAYGIKEQITSRSPLDLVAELLRLQGYAIVESGYSELELAKLSASFDAVYEQSCLHHGGKASLKEIDEHHTIRAPLALDDIFLALATNSNVLAIGQRLLGDHFILNQQNGIVNPPRRGRFSQGAYHRDLPYQHFVTSRPLAINALFCLDEFTEDNGATVVIPCSHKQEAFPSNKAIGNLQRRITAPRGSFIVLDCMLFHRGGINCTARARRAVNHVYSLPFIKQQIELPSLLAGRFMDDPKLRRLLDYDNTPPRDVAGYYAGRRGKRSGK